MTRFGLQLPSFTFPDVADDKLFDRIIEIAQAAEGSGFDSFWVMDHYHQIGHIGPPSDPMLEAYTTPQRRGGAHLPRSCWAPW